MPRDTHHLQRLLEQQRYEEVFEMLLPQVSEKLTTRKNVLSGWRNYLQWLLATGESLLNFTTPEQQYLEWLKAQDVAPATLNNRLVQVRKLYQLLLEQELVRSNPFEGKKGESNPVHERRQVYTKAEVRRLLAHANAEERLLILLGSEAGLSGGEVRFLKFCDLLDGGRQLRIRRVRYRQQGYDTEQLIECSPRLQDAFAQWMKHIGAAPLFEHVPTGFVFDVDGKSLCDHELLWKLHVLCQKAGVSYKPWRSLKHVSGVQKLQKGTDRQVIQQELGLQRLDPLLKLAGAEDGRKTRWRKGKVG